MYTIVCILYSSNHLKKIWRCFEEQRHIALAKLLVKMARDGDSKPVDVFKDHPLYDEWSDFSYLSINMYFKKRCGIVYVVGNPVNRDVYKIGETSGNKDRLKSLRTAGVLGRYELVDSVLAWDRFYCESSAHRNAEKLSTYRDRELFQMKFSDAIKTVQEVVKKDNRILSNAFGICFSMNNSFKVMVI